MARYIWLTDIHLNFLSHRKITEFFIDLKLENSDGIFLTGDISDAATVCINLERLQKITNVPIYFIIGNHDVWSGSFEKVKNNIINLSKNNKNLYYLTQENSISLSPTVSIIGHDTWVDPQLNPTNQFLFFMDWYLIEEFKRCNSNSEKFNLMRDLSFLAAESISKKIRDGFKNCQELFLLTHWPPYYVQQKNDNLFNKIWKPYHYSKIIGQYISNTMIDYPDKKLTILSGHSHLDLYAKISNNIEAFVGESVLRKPKIVKSFII